MPPGVGNKSDVLAHEIARHSGELLCLEGRPGLMPRYPSGMAVRGFPLSSA